jgi:NodT family efflux transporter outer membrane factor (OMF) lipoprotein
MLRPVGVSSESVAASHEGALVTKGLIMTLPIQPRSAHQLCSVLTRSLAPAALLAALAGCTVGPDYKAPEKKVGESFSALDQASAAGLTTTPVTGDVGDITRWWQVFKDPTLDGLVERAVAENLDLRIAASRVREARAIRGIADSALYPTVDATGAASRSRGSENLDFPNPGATDDITLFQAGLDASWEIDVFGGIRRGIEAADADLMRTEESRRGVLVTLLSEVARNYIELRGFQDRLELAREQVKAQKESVDLTQSRAKAGLANDLEVAQATAQLKQREAQIPPLNAGLRQSAHRLGVLLGQEPGTLVKELTAAGTLPQPPSQVPVGLPSDLLRRRPDIREAERGIAGSTARIGVATAELFPKFSLTGGFGLESGDIGDLIDMNSRRWSIAPAIRWRLFDGGAIRNNIEATKAREEQAVLTYERTVLIALEEVENSLTTLVQDQVQRGVLEEGVAANRQAVSLANDRYTSGIGDFINVLQTQSSLYDAQEALVISRINVSRSLIALYKALGGGWDADAPAQEPQATTAPAPAPAQ